MRGVSIAFHHPLSQTDSPSLIPYNTDLRLEGYNHTISANGGFDTATMDLSAPIAEVGDWIDNGLARHVVVTGAGGGIAWEGFVNEINITIGGIDVSIGPVMEIANKVKVRYQTISWDIPDTPVRGVAGETAFAEDTLSQDRYFVLEEILNIGEASTVLNQPTSVRDLYLSENAWPRTRQNVTIGSPSLPRVSLSCLGYYHLLKRYMYSKTGTTSSQDASEKIIDVLQADPNSLVDTTNTGLIESNTTPLPDHEEGDRSGWGVITNAISYGDQNGNRYIFGIVGDRVAYGKGIDANSPDIEYTVTLTTSQPEISNFSGGRSAILPTVRPGRWALISDLNIGLSGLNETLDPAYRDPRYMFIESVDYTMGDGISLSGSRIDSVDQAIARIGLRGLYE